MCLRGGREVDIHILEHFLGHKNRIKYLQKYQVCMKKIQMIHHTQVVGHFPINPSVGVRLI